MAFRRNYAGPARPADTIWIKRTGEASKSAQTHDLSSHIDASSLWSFFQGEAKEEFRDRSLAAYHMVEYASACFQSATMLADAAALTAVAWLTFVPFGPGAVGIGFTILGFVAPNLLHIQQQRKTPEGGCPRVFLKLSSGSTIRRAGQPAA